MSNQANRLSDCPAERLAQCRGQVVPHAGGAAECAICASLGDQCVTCEEAEFAAWADRHFAAADYRQTTAGVFVQDWMRHSFSAWQARSAHITRIQAEVSALQQRLNIADQRVCDLTAEREGLQAEVKHLDLKVSEYDYAFDSQSSELTKAMALLVDAQDRYQHGTLGWYDIQDFLSRQSAPAAKVCSHIWVSADNRGVGAGEICQACSEQRPAAKLDASMIGIVHTPPMEYDEP